MAVQYLPDDAVVPYTGTNASIPTGFTEITAYASRCLRVSNVAGGTDIGDTGGTTQHKHSGTGGSHTNVGAASHYHTMRAPQNSVGSRSGGILLSGVVPSRHDHSHPGFSSSTQTLSTGAGTLEYAYTTNEMQRMEILYLDPDTTRTGVPDGGLAFFDSDTLPSGWTRVGGNSYLRGVATSGDGSSSVVGSNTHGHTDIHTHLAAFAHSHSTPVTSTASTEAIHSQDVQTGSSLVAAIAHTHQVSINSGQDSVSYDAPIDTDASEPEYIKLNIIRNDTGGVSFPDGIILPFKDIDANIPTDWAELGASYDDLFIKGCNANGEVGDTGGTSSGHNHNSGSITCTATSNGHNHSNSTNTNAPSTTIGQRVKSGSIWAASNHGHNGAWEIDDAFPTYTNSTSLTIATTSSEEHYPRWVRVSLIKYTKPPVDGMITKTLMGVGV